MQTRTTEPALKVQVSDVFAAIDYFLGRAKDGARLQLDWLKPVSEEQNAFFRRQIHEYCKALDPPITTLTEGRVNDPGVRGGTTGGYVVVINTIRVVS